MKILIVEDEVHIARHLQKQVAEILSGTDFEITRLALYEEAVTHLENQKIDLLLLDLNLGGQDGFEILKFLSAGAFHTIVVSAYKNRAIEAFEFGVLDFVPKPFTRERLAKAFSRMNHPYHPPREYPVKYYATQKRGRLHLVQDQEVVYFQAYGHYSKIHLRNGTSELYDKSLVKLLPLLNDTYERVHKSYIVKVSEIENVNVQGGGKYRIELKNGKFIPLARSRYKEFKEKWMK